MDIAIQSIREKRGMTQGELAERSGLPAEVIAALEQGQGVQITAEMMRRLALALDAKITEIFFDKDV